MRKGKATVEHAGFALEVNATGVSGKDNWKRVGGLFPSRVHANLYLQKHHASSKRARIYGVRISREPIEGVARKSTSLTRQELQAKFVTGQKGRA